MEAMEAVCEIIERYSGDNNAKHRQRRILSAVETQCSTVCTVESAARGMIYIVSKRSAVVSVLKGGNMVELTLQQARALVDELPAIYAMFSKYSESNFFKF